MNRAVLLLVTLMAGLWLLWRLLSVLLLVFAAVVVGVVLWSLADPLVRLLRLSRRIALVVVLIVCAGLVGGLGFFFGTRLSTELIALVQAIPDLITSLGKRLGISIAAGNLGSWVRQFVDGGTVSNVAGYTLNLAEVITGVIVVLFGGAFLALGAESYRKGVLLLLPRRHRPQVEGLFDEIGRVLRLWLLGQLIAMVAVGVATLAGLFLLGVPSWLSLGLLAGLLEFVPFVGALLAYAAAILVAFGQSPVLALWVTLLFLAIQQVESNLLVPIVQDRTVSLPPALGLFSILAAGALAGPLGILLGIPLTLVVLVTVRHFYVEGVLGEKLSPLGD